MDRTAQAPLIVSAPWLAEHLADANVKVVDTRWYLDGRSGPGAYEAGHIPGAIHLDIDRDLASPKGPGRPGRHPLPEPERFAEALSRAGIGPGSHVVAYDDEGGAMAARLWWLLGYLGFPGQASVLDGGVQAWQGEGRPLEQGKAHPSPAPLARLSPRPGWVVDKGQVKAMSESGSGLLIDARATPRYEGKVEPVDPRPGHIPGAKSAPFVGNLEAPQGRFLEATALRDRYQALGAREGGEVVVYCGSGVTACHDLLALRLAGLEARLYEGSWSDWSSDPSLPASTGPEP